MITQETNGSISFRIYLPHAQNVDLIGDFTEWREHPRRLMPVPSEGPGWWGAKCRVSRGDHSFSYLVDGHFWMPDYAATGVKRDPDGRWISTLCVPMCGSARPGKRENPGKVGPGRSDSPGKPGGRERVDAPRTEPSHRPPKSPPKKGK